jgi:phosphoglycolate phosphatase
MKLVIFDCDGTIVDSQVGIVAAMDHAFGTLGLVPPTREATLSVVGLSLPEAFAVLAGEHDAATQRELAARYKSDFILAKSRAACLEPLYPGAADVIGMLAGRDDVLLAMATGKSQRGVARILDREGWHGHFVSIQTADENPSKPDPGMIEAAMRATGVDQTATIMIGDTTYDMEMAVNAGVTALGVGWGYHPLEHLLAAGARQVLTRFEELPGALDALLARGERGTPS